MRSAVLLRAFGLIAPPLCAGCSLPCAPTQWVCPGCSRELELLRRSIPADSAGPPQAAFEYRGVARRLVTALKFEGAVALAGEMAEAMLGALPECPARGDVLVPAPAHPRHQRRRGFNHARLLADALAERSGASVVDCLRRDGSRPPQSELDRAGRLAMPRGAIDCEPRQLERIVQTNVVVCDDVTTTGVTLELCAQAIRDRLPEGGQASIGAAVFALAVGRGQANRQGTTDREAGAVAPKAESPVEPPPAVRSASVNRSK